jgi:hypothetical protein
MVDGSTPPEPVQGGTGPSLGMECRRLVRRWLALPGACGGVLYLARWSFYLKIVFVLPWCFGCGRENRQASVVVSHVVSCSSAPCTCRVLLVAVFGRWSVVLCYVFFCCVALSSVVTYGLVCSLIGLGLSSFKTRLVSSLPFKSKRLSRFGGFPRIYNVVS